jgi:alkanesulfonate monooxygenase SsuD/methylene tetrahydromethanopterin reductase-like flavin-dependent oxidoreductase (luciferase family)
MMTKRTYWSDSESLFMPERSVVPKPVQTPHPPCWLACASDESAEMAGLARVGLLSFSIFRPTESLAKTIQVYRDAWGRGSAMTEVENDRVAPYTLAYCCESEDELDDPELWRELNWWYSTVLRYGKITQNLINRRLAHFGPTQYSDAEAEVDGQHRSDTDAESVMGASHPLVAARAIQESSSGGLDARDFMDKDMIIVGTPEMCIEKLRRYSDIGADHAICQVEFGRFPHKKIMKSLELLGNKVAPAVASFRSPR